MSRGKAAKGTSSRPKHKKLPSLKVIEDASLKEPTEPPQSLAPKEAQGAMQLVQDMIASVALAKIGSRCLSHFTDDYRLEELHPRLFTCFLVIAFLIEVVFICVVLAVVAYILIGVGYALLRGLGAASQVDHMISVAFHDIT